MPVVLLCILLFCLGWLSLYGFIPAAGAFESSYLPLSARALSHRVRQKLQADPLEPGRVLAIGKISIKIARGGGPFLPETILSAHGTDRNGKPWSYISSAWAGSASVWSADLDHNGTEDLIVLMHTGSCGFSPTSNLLVLMFESSGRPVPFVVDGYFEVDSHGIKDFLDLENDGHCEIVRQSFDDGYWMTSLYEASSSRFHRVNSIGGMKLPLFTRFTLSENHCAIKPPPFRHPFEADLSNNCAGLNKSKSILFLDAIDWPGVEDPCLLFSDGRRSRPVAWYGTMTVVLDEPAGRRMASLSAPEAARRLLSEIRSRRMPVLLNGARRKAGGALSLEYLFAASASNSPHATRRPVLSKSLDLALSAASGNADLP